VTEYRWVEGQYGRLPALAADLVSRNVDLIVTSGGTPAALAAKNATSTIPIVFAGGGDPVGFGLVDSLARPGGNLTGFSNLAGPLVPKRLELLCELIPQATVIALLWNPDNVAAGERHIRFMQEAARTKGVQLPVLRARTEGEIDTAFASFSQLQVGGLVVDSDSFFISRRQQLGPSITICRTGDLRGANVHSGSAPNQQRLASSEMSLIDCRQCDQSSRNLCLGSPVRQEVRVRRLGPRDEQRHRALRRHPARPLGWRQLVPRRSECRNSLLGSPTDRPPGDL
jgi:hypothetical protein